MLLDHWWLTSRPSQLTLPTLDDRSLDSTTGPSPLASATISPMTLLIAVTGTWPLCAPAALASMSRAVDGPRHPHAVQSADLDAPVDRVELVDAEQHRANAVPLERLDA